MGEQEQSKLGSRMLQPFIGVPNKSMAELEALNPSAKLLHTSGGYPISRKQVCFEKVKFNKPCFRLAKELTFVKWGK